MRLELDSIHIDIVKHLSRVQSDELGMFAASEWHRLYLPWVPFRTGTMANTDVTIEPWTIEHTAPYAHRMYEGRFNFRNHPHPLASRKWDKAAEPTQKPKLIEAMQRFIDSGRLGNL